MARSVGEMTPKEFKDLMLSIFDDVLDKIVDSIIATLEELLNPDTIKFVKKSREDIREGGIRRVRIEEIDDTLK